MIKLNHTSLHKIKIHAMKTYPEECCGVLMGRDLEEARVVCDILEMRNAKDEDRQRRYLIQPEDYKVAEEEAKREGVGIVGFYHSHPDHLAQPSEFDLEQAMPYWSYIIVSVTHGQPDHVRSWVMDDDRSKFEEEPIDILDGQFKHHCK